MKNKSIWLHCLAIIISFFCASTLSARKLVIKRAGEVVTSLRSRTAARKDAKGQDCALIIVELASSSSLSFSGNVVGDVNKEMGGYYVYVSPDTKQLSYSHPEYASGVIDFDAMGLELKGKTTYSVILAEAETRTVTFHLVPKNATLRVNGETLVSQDGVCTTEMELGNCNYTVSADNYVPKTASFQLTEGTGAHFLSIELDKERTDTKVELTPKKAKIFVDNTYVGRGNGVYALPLGQHNFRVMANGYSDEIQDIAIAHNNPPLLFALNRLDQKSAGVQKSIRNRMSIYAAFGFPKFTGYDIKSEGNNCYTFGLSGEHYTKRIFFVKYGMELTGYMGDEEIENEKGGPTWTLDVPLTFDFNIPMGRLNRGGFSFGVGPVLGWSFARMESSISHTGSDGSDYDQNLMHGLHYGLRGEARLQINHFVLGAQYTWSQVYQYEPHGKEWRTNYKCVIPALTIGYLY